MSKINRKRSYAFVKLRLSAARLADAAAVAWDRTKDEVKLAMRRRVKPRFWLIMIAVTLIVFCASYAVMNRRYAQGVQRLQRVRENRDRLILQVDALSDSLSFARTDDYVVRTARDELGMIMPGEVRYVNGAR